MTDSSPPFSEMNVEAKLDDFYQQIERVILSRQNPLTGLLPASTAVTAHGDYTDAWVRDNVYSILSVWGLAMAYRRQGTDKGRAYQLEQSVVKLMRGLLLSMMKQSDKVERFKHTQHPIDALHAKYDTYTGEVVVGDEEWGHLQIDATSLFLLLLAQMTASGLRIIFNLDEVHFIQNLVHYIGRAYRTPDFGIWERGNKINHGIAELNMSSVGMAKAALEAMDDFNLFGADAGPESQIRVIADEIARARDTLENMLPRESNSKEVDAALLSIIGYPAYSIEKPELITRTRDTILKKLSGKYGCKRFLRDGHQTCLEDPDRLHYEPLELQQFEHIESEWPLFYTYLMLDMLVLENTNEAAHYEKLLQPLFQLQDDVRLLPELYFVEADKIDAEKQTPHSQVRVANENLPLVWAQSLYLLGELLRHGFLCADDIDPLQRRKCIGREYGKEILVAVVAENKEVKDFLAAQSIRSELRQDIHPVKIYQADDLAEIYCLLGFNRKLQLSGRPMRRLRSMATSHAFELDDEIILFLPQILNQHDFYLTSDIRLLAEQIRSELAYLHQHWQKPENPLLTLMISKEGILENENGDLLSLLRDIQAGECMGIPVRSENLGELLSTANRERIDFLPHQPLPTATEMVRPTCGVTLPVERAARGLGNKRLAQDIEIIQDPKLLCSHLHSCNNLNEYIHIVTQLWKLSGGDYETGLAPAGNCTVRDLTEQIYETATTNRYWSTVRRSAALLEKFDATLEDAVVEILIRQKQLAVGRAYSRAAVISSPMSNVDILEKIRRYCGDDEVERILNQEMVLYLAMLIKAEPELFEGMITLRISHLLHLLIARLARDYHWPQHAAFEYILAMSPYTLAFELREVIAGYQHMEGNIVKLEALHSEPRSGELTWVRFPTTDDPDTAQSDPDWHHWRETQGTVGRLEESFFVGIWNSLKHCKGIIIGDRFNPKNCLDSASLRSEMTSGEKNFVLRVEHLLNKCQAPDYRQLVMEALHALNAIFGANRELILHDHIIVDVLIGHAVRLAWLDMHPEQEQRYNESRGQAWTDFYASPPHQVANAFMAAFDYLLEPDEELPLGSDKISQPAN